MNGGCYEREILRKKRNYLTFSLIRCILHAYKLIQTHTAMKRLTLLLTLLIPALTFSQIINIPDDYPTIQQGIDAASTCDTVLVDTGTYVENINFNGKNITVASLFLITHDTSYISQTVIDGGNGNNSSVVAFYNGEDSTALLCGFVLQNGEGTWVGDYPSVRNLGGGIYCFESNPTFQNLIITNNESYDAGGGIYFELSQSTLQNVTIKNNSSQFGGGVNIGTQCDLVFDSVKLCNVFANHAAVGNDIYSVQPSEIYLDTFSVMTPTAFYLAPLKNIMLNIQNGTLELTDSDMYVSPNGDNNNDGQSEETPLKTIQHAFSMILADSLHQHTVHLLDGTYGVSNDELFPIYIPDYIHLQGSNKDSIIIEGTSTSVFYFDNNMSTKLSGLTITKGDGMYGRIGGGIFCGNANPIFENLILKDNGCLENGGGLFITNSDVTMRNLNIINNRSEFGYSGGILCSFSNVYIESSTILNNDHGGIEATSSNVIFKNVLITNNEDVGIIALLSNLHLINTTVSGHEGEAWDGGVNGYFSNIILENSVLWNNKPAEIYFSNDSRDTLHMSYTDIQNGNSGIISNDSTIIYWLEGNIDQDPLFVGSGDHPYQINDYSPCIDAGTPDTTGLNLPEYDLAGEVRIFNDSVDMGAYEWNTFVGIEEASMPEKNNLQLNYYPNPFSTSTTIQYELNHPETIRITFYNQFGKQVDVIEESQFQGLNKVVWTPKNLADGIYFFRLQAGEQITTGKLILMK